MENYSAELDTLMNKAQDSFMQLKLWNSSFLFALCSERDAERMFIFIIVENLCSIKRNSLMFVAINIV